jgi:hypothetical protein
MPAAVAKDGIDVDSGIDFEFFLDFVADCLSLLADRALDLDSLAAFSLWSFESLVPLSPCVSEELGCLGLDFWI